MSAESTCTLQQVLVYVADVFRNSRLMIQDAARELRNATKCHFEHFGKWDYTWRPNEHFLYEDQNGFTSRAWIAYIPNGELCRGAMFYLEFYGTQSVVEPALMYGSFDLGSKAPEAVNRWALPHTIIRAEEQHPTVTVQKHSVLTTVLGTGEESFPEAVLVRVPLESIRDMDCLRRIVVAPLAALVRGNNDEAVKLLEGVRTIPWPVEMRVTKESDEDEQEQA